MPFLILWNLKLTTLGGPVYTLGSPVFHESANTVFTCGD